MTTRRNNSRQKILTSDFCAASPTNCSNRAMDLRFQKSYATTALHLNTMPTSSGGTTNKFE